MASRWRSAGVAAVAGGLMCIAVAPAGAAARTGGGCNAATARKLVEEEQLGNAGFMPQPVAQVLCGPFLGPRSRAMVVSLSTPGCGFSMGWVLYGKRRGEWRRVFRTDRGAYLAKAGSRIRAWQGVLGPNDAHCFPSRWRSRYWRWNGARLVAGRWHRSGPPPSPLPGVPH
jgi:hypothetical protein